MITNLKVDSVFDKVIYQRNRGHAYKRSNKVLSKKQLNNLVVKEISRREKKIIKTTERFLNGNLSFEEWQARMSNQIRSAHVNMLRYGRGGKENTFAIQYLNVGREIKNVHYPALENFSMDIKRGKLTQKQIINRARLYARASRSSFEYGKKSQRAMDGKTQARRLLSGVCSPHCQECQTYASYGWVNISDLILPTQQCSCGGNCCCSVEYR